MKMSIVTALIFSGEYISRCRTEKREGQQPRLKLPETTKEMHADNEPMKINTTQWLTFFPPKSLQILYSCLTTFDRFLYSLWGPTRVANVSIMNSHK